MTWTWIAGAYLLGSIPFGFLIARMRGIDLRTFGSGNIGATNAMRALGKPLGIGVLLLDVGKGFLPVFLAQRPTDLALPLGCGVAAVIGHTFPLWLGFKGGKGVATGLGVWLALDPVAGLAAIAAFELALVATRYVSLASILGAFAMPVALKVQGRQDVLTACALGMAVLIALKHRGNLVRIAAGVEPRVGAGGKA